MDFFLKKSKWNIKQTTYYHTGTRCTIHPKITSTVQHEKEKLNQYPHIEMGNGTNYESYTEK